VLRLLARFHRANVETATTRVAFDVAIRMNSKGGTDKPTPKPSIFGARWWSERSTARAVQWFLGDRNWEAAKRLAWGDLENEWHYLHGKRWPSWQCAGCNAPLGGSQALNLPDGNRVHFEPIDCLINFGKSWRGAACEALIAFGLEPPSIDGDQL
jgi:hypothetical protein